MIVTLRDAVLLVAALAVSLGGIAHGVGTFVSPRWFLGRVYGTFVAPVGPPSGRIREFIRGLDWRATGVLLSVGGIAVAITVLRALLGVLGVVERVKGAGSKATTTGGIGLPIVTLIVTVVGTVLLAKPSWLLRVYGAGMPGVRFRREMEPFLKVRARIVGIGFLLAASHTLTMWI